MSIRRELLLRSALLRLPDLAALRGAIAARPPETPSRRRPAVPARRPRGAAAASFGTPSGGP